MPIRNSFLVLFVTVVSFVCYDQAQRNRFATLYAEAAERISTNYVEQVNRRELFESAMKGMLEDLDPYSSYIGLEEYADFREDLNQKFGGIGIIVSPEQNTKQLVVLSPVFGTPAHRAGILAGDIILEVDGESIEGWSLRESVERLRGRPGTQVSITVQQKDEAKPREITIVRALIKVPSVLGDTRTPEGSWQYILHDYPYIGYIRLTKFGEQTVEELQSVLADLNQQELAGLIIDLRWNAGGLLSAAVDTCDMFIDGGVIVSTRGRGGNVLSTEQATRDIAVDLKMPMAVLVNQFSASASEIVAGCLQDHDRAVIVGVRTWGKGTVQNVIPLEIGKSVMKLTTATFWRPSNKNIHRSKKATDEDKWGIIPNEGFEVKLSNEENRKVARARNKEEIATGDLDPESDEESPSSESSNDVQPAESSTNDVENGTEFIDPQLRRAVEFIEQAKQKSESPTAT